LEADHETKVRSLTEEVVVLKALLAENRRRALVGGGLVLVGSRSTTKFRSEIETCESCLLLCLCSSTSYYHTPHQLPTSTSVHLISSHIARFNV